MLDDPQCKVLREQIAARKAEARLCDELGPLLGLEVSTRGTAQMFPDGNVRASSDI